MSDLSDFIGQARTRVGKLLLIEQAIRQLSPDYLETCDILDAIIASIETKYADDDVMDILHELGQAKEALEEADITQAREPDIMDLAKRGMDSDS